MEHQLSTTHQQHTVNSRTGSSGPVFPLPGQGQHFRGKVLFKVILSGLNHGLWILSNGNSDTLFLQSVM